jgi:thymidylate synthase ThyX
MQFIRPTWIKDYTASELTKQANDPEFTVISTDNSVDVWLASMLEIKRIYDNLLANGCSPQSARGVLPNDLKTEIVVGANLREWKHIFELRNSSKAHPDIQRLMAEVEYTFHSLMPIIFPLRVVEC